MMSLTKDEGMSMAGDFTGGIIRTFMVLSILMMYLSEDQTTVLNHKEMVEFRLFLIKKME